MALTLGLAAAVLAAALAAFLAVWIDRRRRRRPALEGRTAIVNTPKPDDQALRGLVMRELAGGGLVLAAAVYLEPGQERGQPIIRERPAGDVVVPAYSWAQIISPTAAAAAPTEAQL